MNNAGEEKSYQLTLLDVISREVEVEFLLNWDEKETRAI
jgi:hypothetical protein|tara:strand:+ start:2833 stop:2949 length:117 start_codon:yes stop_codon:yes gene_type:complete